MIFPGSAQALRRWVNFALWLAILLLILAGETGAAALVVAGALGLGLLAAALRALGLGGLLRRSPRPKSDLPYFNFENVKPSDFEDRD